mgnify:CR=1 FL=1
MSRGHLKICAKNVKVTLSRSLLCKLLPGWVRYGIIDGSYKIQEVIMIFSIRDLSFEFGSVLLEGWFALAARAGCALKDP